MKLAELPKGRNWKTTSKGAPTKALLWSAIKAHCAECIGSKYQVADCTAPKCRLFPYRLGPGRLDEARTIPAQAQSFVTPDQVGAGHGEAT